MFSEPELKVARRKEGFRSLLVAMVLTAAEDALGPARTVEARARKEDAWYWLRSRAGADALIELGYENPEAALARLSKSRLS